MVDLEKSSSGCAQKKRKSMKISTFLIILYVLAMSTVVLLIHKDDIQRLVSGPAGASTQYTVIRYDDEPNTELCADSCPQIASPNVGGDEIKENNDTNAVASGIKKHCVHGEEDATVLGIGHTGAGDSIAQNADAIIDNIKRGSNNAIIPRFKLARREDSDGEGDDDDNEESNNAVNLSNGAFTTTSSSDTSSISTSTNDDDTSTSASSSSSSTTSSFEPEIISPTSSSSTTSSTSSTSSSSSSSTSSTSPSSSSTTEIPTSFVPTTTSSTTSSSSETSTSSSLIPSFTPTSSSSTTSLTPFSSTFVTSSSSSSSSTFFPSTTSSSVSSSSTSSTLTTPSNTSTTFFPSVTSSSSSSTTSSSSISSTTSSSSTTPESSSSLEPTTESTETTESSTTESSESLFSSDYGSYEVVARTTLVHSEVQTIYMTMTATPDDSNSKNQSGISQHDKNIAIGVSVGLGVPIIAALLALFLLFRKRRSSSSVQNYVDSNGRETGIAVDDDNVFTKVIKKALGSVSLSPSTHKSLSDDFDEDDLNDLSTSNEKAASNTTNETGFFVNRPKPLRALNQDHESYENINNSSTNNNNNINNDINDEHF